VNSTFSRNVC